MTPYEIYIFILCFIVFSLLTLLFSYMIYTITKMQLKMIRHGLEDETLKKEYRRNLSKGCAGTVIGKVISLLVCAALCAMFCFSVYIHTTEDKAPNGIPSIKVVKSDSMAKKHDGNTYLYENDLDDQIQTFDIIITRHLPPEEELEVFDIVVYKQDDIYVIHRIVGIEEPNENHPNERHFLLQGDANKYPDEFPVLYSQMQGIYTGERIPFAGSFILFLQSPAGWLCILLVLFAMIATPIVEKAIAKETAARLLVINAEEKQCEREKEKENATSNLTGV